MSITLQVYLLLQQFGLEMYGVKGEAYVYEINNPKSISPVKFDGNEKISFTINDMKFTIYGITKKPTNIFDEAFTFYGGKIEILCGNRKMIIDGRNMSYSRKKDSDPNTNAVSFEIKKGSISFNSNHEGVSSSVVLKYDDNYKYHSMRSSTTFIDEFRLLTEKKIYNEKDGFTRKTITSRKCEKDGEVSFRSVSTNIHDISIDDFVRSTIEPNSIFSDVFIELDDMLPGVIDYFGKFNPNIKDIKNRNNRQYS